MSETTDLDHIKQYYQDVDSSTTADDTTFHVHQGSITKIMDLFDQHAWYARSTQEPFQGKEAIYQFFSVLRPLCGTHQLEDFTTTSNGTETNITVHGHFKGFLYETEKDSDTPDQRNIIRKTPANLDFTDSWHLRDGKVVSRISEIIPKRHKSYMDHLVGEERVTRNY